MLIASRPLFGEVAHSKVITTHAEFSLRFIDCYVCHVSDFIDRYLLVAYTLKVVIYSEFNVGQELAMESITCPRSTSPN